MPLVVQWGASGALVNRLRAIQDAASETGRGTSAVKGDIRAIVEQDHRDKMLRGVTRYGTPRAPLAPSTLAARARKGLTGPSLVPRGLQSRYITTFRTAWESDNTGYRVLVARFVGFTSPSGFPIPVAHERGAGAGRWSLPARPVMGITPAGWAQVVARHARFVRTLGEGD